MDAERLADPTSQIAQERVAPGPPSVVFWVALALLSAGLFGVLVVVGFSPAGPTASEQAAAVSPLGLLDRLGIEAARMLSAGSIAVAAGCIAIAGRRLLHSDGAGILAAVVFAIDPGTLALGRLATPDALILACLAGALACFLSVPNFLQWVGGALLAVAAIAEPRAALWGIPFAAMVLLRGHIYAAPRHLGESMLQAVVPGVVVGAAALVWGQNAPLCGSAASQLFLTSIPLHGTIAVEHNPILWFGGLGALTALAVVVLVGAARQMRIARLPGRIQFRLPDAVHPMAGRILWLAALAILAPIPAAWMLVGALALAAGVVWLSEDAPGFGLAVALVLVGFGLVGLVRAWPLVTGLASPERIQGLLGLVPWARGVACPP